LVAISGGFNDVPVQKLPVISIGETHVGNELATTVTGIRLSPTAPVTEYDAPEGEEFLIVEATLENVTNDPNLFASRLLRVIVDGALDGNDAPDRVVELRTGGYADVLQPGLPTKIAFLWPVPAGSIDEGAMITIGIFERYDMVDDPRFDDSKTNPVPVARITSTIGATS
jgi:hypothetical protein